MLMRLGRVRAPQSPRVPHLSTVWADKAAPALSTVDWYSRVPSWPMLANDQVGDCTCAAIGHIIQQWTTYTDTSAVVMSDAEVLGLYSAVSGYVPGNPATDNGALCVDVLRYWFTAGVRTPDGGPDTLIGAAGVNPTDFAEVSRAILTFGNLYAGVALPSSAQTEEVWTSTADAPGSWGGHCIPLVGLNPVGPLCVTWGALKQMTWSWWARYAEEAYVLLSPDWMRTTGTDPSGLNWDQLAQAMKAL